MSDDDCTYRASVSGRLSRPDCPALTDDERGPIHLFTFGTPMGRKVQILIEELRGHYGSEVEWTWEKVSLPDRIQKSDWYMKLNPDGRIPIMIDKSITDDNGLPSVITESTAILLHLYDLFDRDEDNVFGFDVKEAYERQSMMSWIMFTTSALAPAQSQANHWCSVRSSAPALERSVAEVHRLYQVVEGRLSGSKRKYLCGKGEGKFSLADIDVFGWIYIHDKFGIMTREEFQERYPALTSWLALIWDRPGVRRGVLGYDSI